MIFALHIFEAALPQQEHSDPLRGVCRPGTRIGPCDHRLGYLLRSDQKESTQS